MTGQPEPKPISPLHPPPLSDVLPLAEVELVIAGRLSRVLAWACILALLLGVPLISFYAPEQSGRTMASLGAGVIGLVTLGLLRRGKIQAAMRWVLWGTWLLIVLACTFNGGVGAPALSAVVMLAAFAALTVGLRQSLVLCGLTTLLCVLWIVREHQGPTPAPVPPELRAMLYVVISTMTATMLWKTANMLRATAAKAHAETTLRARTKEALQQSEERYQLAVRGSGAGLWDWDMLTDEVFYAPGFKAMLGYDEHEFPNRISSFFEALHVDDRDAVQRAIDAHCSPQAIPFEMEYRLRTKSGNFRCFFARGAALRNEQGQPCRMAGSIIDITERRVLEEQLLNAQKMEAVGQLAGGVAHDFNNLMTVIEGYCSLLLKDLDAEEPRRRFVEEIRKETGRGAALTQQLLIFSREDSSQRRPVSLNDVVVDVVKMVDQLHANSIEVVSCCAPQLALVLADPTRLHQILMNLVTNARHAMPKGGRLTIETSNLRLKDSNHQFAPAASGDYVMLIVRDTGVGMSPEVRARVFEPYFTNRNDGSGNGLGLSIVHGIVKAKGGHIFVQSKVGDGTTFTILLPQYKGLPPVRETEPISTLKSIQRTETVLLVEDNSRVREVTKSVLQSEGYTVVAVNGAAEALLCCADLRGQIHLVLSDVDMPGMNGVELMAQIHQLDPRMKVVLMSGYPKEQIMGDALFSGDVVFLLKPFGPERLLLTLQEMLG